MSIEIEAWLKVRPAWISSWKALSWASANAATGPPMRRNGSEMGSSPDVLGPAVGQANPVAEQEGGSL